MTEPDADSTINLAGLHLPWKTTVAVVVSTLLLMVDYYYHFLPITSFSEGLRRTAYERTVLYLIIPLLIVVLIFRERPSTYGFTFGDWRAGLKWTLIVWAVAAPVLYLAGRTPTMTAFYARYGGQVVPVILTTGLDLFGWEFLFRGFLLFALYRVAGPSAVVLQAVPFAMAHLGKPPLETLSTIFGGTLFGWVAWRTNSFLYPFLVHWYIHVFVVLVAMSA